MSIETFAADNNQDLRNLHAARRAGYEKLKHFREMGADTITQIVGPYYGEAKKGKKKTLQPYNALYQALRIYVANLVPRQPLVRTRPKQSALRAYSTTLEIRMNQWGETDRLKDTLRGSLLEALVYPHSIVRVGEKAGDDAWEIGNEEIPVGEAFAGLVTFDDWCMDPDARNDREKGFESVRYRVSREAYAASGVLDGQALARFLGMPSIHDEGDESSKSEDITNTSDANDRNRLRELVELWDTVIFHNDTIEIVTTSGERDGEVLNRVMWEGPPNINGPLHKLCFQPVPNNPMPLPPLYNLRQFSTAMDELLTKLIKQLKAAKTVYGYKRQGGIDDMKAIQDAADLDAVGMDDTKNVVALPYGGVQSGIFDAFKEFQSMWNTLSGNLLTLGGQSDPTKTATATVQNNQNAGVLIGDMSDAVQDHATAICNHVKHYKVTNPGLSGTVPMKLSGGTMVDIPFNNRANPLDPNSAIDPNQIEIGIDVVSMQRMDPRMRLRSITEFLTACTPVLALQQFGIPVNAEALGRMGSRELDAPEITEIFGIDAAQAQAQAAMQAGAQQGMGVPGAQIQGMVGSMAGPAQGAPNGQPQPGNPARGGAQRAPQRRPIDDVRSAYAGAVPN